MSKYDAAGIGPGGTLDGSALNEEHEIQDAQAYIRRHAKGPDDAKLIRQALGIDF